MILPPVETVLFKYMLTSAFLEIIQSSRHASHSLQYKGSWLYAQCSSQQIPFNSSNQICDKICLGLINDAAFITHIHAVKCSSGFKTNYPTQSVFGVGAFLTFIQCSCVVTSVDNHVSQDDNMRLSFKCSIVSQSVLVVCICSMFIQMHSPDNICQESQSCFRG